MKTIISFLILFLLLLSSSTIAQEPEKDLPSVFDEALTDVTAYKNLEYLCKNTKGRLDGSLKPHEYITVGGHLDSWDITEGAHDDAGGCVQVV